MTCCFSNGFSVISFVSHEIISLFNTFYELARNLTVVHFTPSDFKMDRTSMRVNGHMYFCCRSTSAASNCSIFIVPSSRCMLMSADVTSIDGHPLLISFASYIKKKSLHNPFNDQRLSRLYAVFPGHRSWGISRHVVPVCFLH